jgi:PAS domain S-box-containing protein
MVAVVGPDGQVLLANRALREACGWPAEDEVGRSWRDCLVEDDPVARADFARWIAADVPQGPVEVRLRDGGEAGGRWLRWYRARPGDEHGPAHAVALVGFDVSRERDNEAKLRRSTRFYRALSDMNAAMGRLRDATSLYQAACDIAVASGGAHMAWVGLSEGGSIKPVAWGGVARRYTDGLNLPIDEQEAGQRGPSREAFRSTIPVICNDVETDPRMGPWRDRARASGVRASAAFPILRNGVCVGVLNLYFAERHAFDDQLVDLARRMVSDVEFALDKIDRERARAEAERIASDRELQLSGLVDSAMDAIIAVDASHRVVLFNAAAARMFGAPAEAVIGGTLDRFIPPDAREAHRHHVERYGDEGRTSQQMGASRGLVGMRANGEIFPIEASISRSGEGERLLMMVMVRDLSELRRAEREQSARLQAEAASRAKTEFLSRMSHELRTPLNAVLGFSQLLRADERDPLSARHREQVDLVIQAGDHLRTLIEEMLDFAGIESGRVAIEPRDFELRALLDGVLRMSAPHAHDSGVLLESSYAARAGILMRSDPARVRQIVLNLVSNAIKYNRRGGRVWVDFEPIPGRVRITIRDDGIGMTPSQLAQLFQPFNRLGREWGTTPGMGIGLVLVRQLARLLGGDVAVESAGGNGTTVSVTLPAVAASPPAAGDDPVVPVDAESHEVRGRVLYIEDNSVNALLIEQMLARWPGVWVLVAGDGAQGLAQAATFQPDVILLDMQLPDMSGLEVLRRLRARMPPRLPIIALSASALPDEVAAARAAGADDYWTKPVQLDVFIADMRRLLESRK